MTSSGKATAEAGCRAVEDASETSEEIVHSSLNSSDSETSSDEEGVCSCSNCLDDSETSSDEGSLHSSSNSSDEDSETSSDEEIGSKYPGIFVQSFKELLDTGLYSDVTIKVKDQTFQAHQLVLETRSPVFESMFQHDMEEKSSRVINIDDCQPDAFKDFLEYLYTGKVDHIIASSILSIYYIADKYDVKELMDACRVCLRSNISVNSFCDTVIIASMHNDEELRKSTIDYFIVHAEDILQSQGWLSFLPDHATLANELLQKLFLRDKKYRNEIRIRKIAKRLRTQYQYWEKEYFNFVSQRLVSKTFSKFVSACDDWNKS